MQWIIDIIAAKVIADIGIPPTFIDRGDSAPYDWQIPFWTIDGAFHSLDLSGIIPTNATGVALTLQIMSNAAASIVLFNPRLTGGNANQSALLTQVAGLVVRQDAQVLVGPNRTIQYLIVPAAWVIIDVAIKGWWL